MNLHEKKCKLSLEKLCKKSTTKIFVRFIMEKNCSRDFEFSKIMTVGSNMHFHNN